VLQKRSTKQNRYFQKNKNMFFLQPLCTHYLKDHRERRESRISDTSVFSKKTNGYPYPPRIFTGKEEEAIRTKEKGLHPCGRGPRMVVAEAEFTQLSNLAW